MNTTTPSPDGKGRPVYCAKCGTEAATDAAYCWRCGSPVRHSLPPMAAVNSYDGEPTRKGVSEAPILTKPAGSGREADPRLLSVRRPLVLAWLILYGLICFYTLEPYLLEQRTLGYVVGWHLLVTAVWTVALLLVNLHAHKPSIWGYVWRTVLMMWVCVSFSMYSNRGDDSLAPFLASLVLCWPFAWLFYSKLRRRPKGDIEPRPEAKDERSHRHEGRVSTVDSAQARTRFRLRMAQNYLEVARAVWVPIRHSTGSTEAFVAQYGQDPLVNATVAMTSITVIYSYLALEAFCNYQLYDLWKRRNDGTEASRRFLGRLGDVTSFEKLRIHKETRTLEARLNTVCDILNFQKPHEALPELWQQFKALVKTSRHFLVHPSPAPEIFQDHMVRLGHQVKIGEYPRVAGDLIGFFYAQAGRVPPEWLHHNTLFRFTGAELLSGAEHAGAAV